jgi:xylulokinase
MNDLARGTRTGADGLLIYPFGNGAERMLCNKDPGAGMRNLNFNIHTNAHLFRAAQEGIVFSIRYGLDIMSDTGIVTSLIRAGAANMFQSPLFREALSCITGAEIHLYNTDGSIGAARGAGIGCGYYKSVREAFGGLNSVGVTRPDRKKTPEYEEAYDCWVRNLAAG